MVPKVRKVETVPKVPLFGNHESSPLAEGTTGYQLTAVQHAKARGLAVRMASIGSEIRSVTRTSTPPASDKRIERPTVDDRGHGPVPLNLVVPTWKDRPRMVVEPSLDADVMSA